MSTQSATNHSDNRPPRHESKPTVHTETKSSENTRIIGEWIGSMSMFKILAMILSYHTNHSIFWCIIHGFLGWIYVIYFVFVHHH